MSSTLIVTRLSWRTSRFAGAPLPVNCRALLTAGVYSLVFLIAFPVLLSAAVSANCCRSDAYLETYTTEWSHDMPAYTPAIHLCS